MDDAKPIAKRKGVIFHFIYKNTKNFCMEFLISHLFVIFASKYFEYAQGNRNRRDSTRHYIQEWQAGKCFARWIYFQCNDISGTFWCENKFYQRDRE